MLDLNKNSDFQRLDSGKVESEYYDWNYDLEKGELWNKLALDQMIESVLVTEPHERLFNLGYGSPLYRVLFENFSRLEAVMSLIFDTIEFWVPIQIDRTNTKVEADEDNNTISFQIPYISNNGMVAGIFARRIGR
jgi:hypothetical protein